MENCIMKEKVKVKQRKVWAKPSKIIKSKKEKLMEKPRRKEALRKEMKGENGE